MIRVKKHNVANIDFRKVNNLVSEDVQTKEAEEKECQTK